MVLVGFFYCLWFVGGGLLGGLVMIVNIYIVVVCVLCEFIVKVGDLDLCFMLLFIV